MKIFSGLLILFFLPQKGLTSSNDIPSFLERLNEVYQFDKEGRAIKQQIQGETSSLTALDNPQIQVGRGQVSSQGLSGDFTQFSISQNLQINGQKSLLKDKSKNLSALGELQVLEEQRLLEGQVLQLAFEVKSKSEHLEHLEERSQELSQIKGYLKSKKFVSPKDLTSQALLSNAFDELLLKKIMIQKELTIKKNELNRILQWQKDNLNIPWLNLQSMKQVVQGLPVLPTLVKDKNDHRLAALSHDLRSAKRQWVPDVQLSYSDSREYTVSGNRNQTFTVGLDIPLFNAGSSKASAIESAKDRETIHQLRSLSKTTAELQSLRDEFYRVYELVEKLQGPLTKKKDKDFRRTLNFFKNGQIDALSLLEVEKQSHWYHEQQMEELHKLHYLFVEFYRLYPQHDSFKGVFNASVL